MATKAQLARLTKIMDNEDGEYETPEQMARALYKESVAIFNESDAWVGITKLPANVPFPFELWGGFDDKTTAKKLMKAFEGAVGFVKLNGLTSLNDREKVALPPEVKRTDCSTCGHPLGHHWPGTKTRKKGCMTARCDCTDGPGSAYKK